MYAEDELLPISALQHLSFCERQWALIHLERVWEENQLTAEGRVMHERPHESGTEERGDVRIARGLRLRSLRLGLFGQADVVEFHRVTGEEGGALLDGVAGRRQPLIIEYKRGHPKIGHEDKIQLCAQALCLEEMLGTPMPLASFFYGEQRRRLEVVLDDALRKETEDLTRRLHELTRLAKTPLAIYAAKCRRCSLFDICLPKATNGQISVQKYLQENVEESKGTGM